MTAQGLEILPWKEVGYQPLVFSDGWQAAILNWEPAFDLDQVSQVERHNQTDEVFVLTWGKAVLFVIDETGMQVEEMQHGVIYNVHAGVWHTLVSTRDASLIIIENRDTHLHDCEYRSLTKPELDHLNGSVPSWVG